MVKVRLHGDIGDKLGKEWNLKVNSVAEAFRAIDVNTGKFAKYFIGKVEEDAKYEILINQRHLWMPNQDKLPDTHKKLKKEHIENLYKSETFINFGDKLETIDVVPIIEGAGGGGGGKGGGKGGGGKAGGKGFFAIFLALIAIFAAPFLGPAAIPMIVGLLALGVSMLLMKPPPMVSPQSIANPSADFEASPSAGGEPSYLFNGPTNTQGEGGPIPVGYGRLIIGSHQVFSSYDQLYRIQSRRNVYDSAGRPPTDGGQRNFPGQSYLFDLKGRAIQLTDIVGNSLEKSSLGSK